MLPLRRNTHAAEQQQGGEDIAEDRQPTRRNGGVERDSRRRDHEDASHLDHVDIHHCVDGGAGEMIGRRTDQFFRFCGKGYEDPAGGR
jgi:hypothetical protein